jgi:beta-N-acetylhexosaminidase
VTAPAWACAVLLPGFVGETLPEWFETRLRNGLAGVCLFGSNVTSRQQLRRLTDQIHEANPHALIAIDEEGGDVTRLYHETGSPWPGNAVLGRIDDLAYTESVATAVGWELRGVGVNLGFAPDVDINSNPDNPVIGARSFGADPALVARHSAAWLGALERTAVASSAKHFPGHGDTAADSHRALPVSDLPLDELRARELMPFAAAIAAGTRTIMTAHILVPQVDASGPVTFSRVILQELLREELGFEGVIVSDALDMKGASGEIGIPAAAVRALAAGCDLLCIGTNNSDEQLAAIEAEIQLAVEDGRLDEARLAEAIARTSGLGRQLHDEALALPIPEGVTVASPENFPIERTIGAFDIRPGTVLQEGRVLISVATEANAAVGVSPWGVAAAGAETLWIAEGEAVHVPAGAQPVVIGKDNHRHAWVRDAIDRLRQEHPDTVVVDMGWPSDDRAYADVATFGSSRHVGQALLAWLDAGGQ